MIKKLLDDCFVNNQALLKHDDAVAILRERICPMAAVECLPLERAPGRILAQPAIARTPVPAHTNAAVDGYSFSSSAYDIANGSELLVAGRATAGHPWTGQIATACAIRIFTGAPMPEGHDTVAMQEDTEPRCKERQTLVRIPPALKTGANVRHAGEDVKPGETLLTPGAVIRPQDLAALASIGFGRIDVFKRLRVAIVSTGDEVVRPSAELEVGQVYDANAPMLRGLVASAGAEVTDLGILPDEPRVIRDCLAAAARDFDVILTSGGASRGEEDHMVAALDELGKRHLWQIAIKPGRPMSFGHIGNSVLLELPGNPVAVFVCFLLYAWPLIRRLSGGAWPEPRRYRLPAAFTFANRKTGRREFWRGIIKEQAGGLAVDKYPRDGSGLISGLRAADGLIDIPEFVQNITPGDIVAFIPFSDFGLLGR
jgi:molybdopterin molybdotransferase